jgi:hypothetical protein
VMLLDQALMIPSLFQAAASLWSLVYTNPCSETPSASRCQEAESGLCSRHPRHRLIGRAPFGVRLPRALDLGSLCRV